MPEENTNTPVINPILSLISKPRREGITGFGKTEKDIRQNLLASRRRLHSRKLKELLSVAGEFSVSGKMAVVVKMDSASLAPTKTPVDLFSKENGAQLLAPFKGGYIAEIETSFLEHLAGIVLGTEKVKEKVDISRIESLSLILPEHVFGEKDPRSIFKQAINVGANGEVLRKFLVWFVPFKEHTVRQKAVETATSRLTERKLASKKDEQGSKKGVPLIEERLSLPIISRLNLTETTRDEFVTTIYALSLSTPDQLNQLASSGKVIRIDPVVPFIPTQAEEPTLPKSANEDATVYPIVGVIDGGCTARSYSYAEAWRAQELVPQTIANTAHGNQVSSLVVNGHELNPHLVLPKIKCRFGVAQALVHDKYQGHAPSLEDIVGYLDKVIRENPETKVWNISANQHDECDYYGVSFLGHAISTLARKYNVLPVISAGNRSGNQPLRISPPADCEAGLTVSGRLSDQNGKVASACPISRIGLGPDEMLKPDVSWFSSLKVLGNQSVKGTSYSAPLVSKLAAHTWEKLKTPSPDLVKALLLNGCDLNKFDQQRGWGSPVVSDKPWECESGSVCLAWNSKLQAGMEYYWDEITIPPALLDGNKLQGHICLTAILDPALLNLQGVGNYCMSRIEVSLQDAGLEEDDTNSNVLGSMQKRLTEIQARKIDHKWSPIRRHSANFRGKALRSNSLRLRARIFTSSLLKNPPFGENPAPF